MILDGFDATVTRGPFAVRAPIIPMGVRTDVNGLSASANYRIGKASFFFAGRRIPKWLFRALMRVYLAVARPANGLDTSSDGAADTASEVTQ